MSRLAFHEWETLNEDVYNFEIKVQILANVVKNEEVDNISRFTDRARDFGIQMLLPKLNDRIERMTANLNLQVSEGIWEGIAEELVSLDQSQLEDMLEIAEELFRVMDPMDPRVITDGLETLWKELEPLNCSQMHRQIYCQLGLSLLVKLVKEDKRKMGKRVVKAIAKTNVDVTNLKLFSVSELVYLDDSFCPIACCRAPFLSEM